ncbi:zinc ribbon domain-containing protein [Natronomonas halophila]|uniref:zinc ribbon domain-containing protein n=1 Tax=Natronomonas halophila TaxID=2747817 RepID=UPI001FE6B484|nr:zinc ribbon domain-containing protein [Natronomonas halophila]
MSNSISGNTTPSIQDYQEVLISIAIGSVKALDNLLLVNRDEGDSSVVDKDRGISEYIDIFEESMELKGDFMDSRKMFAACKSNAGLAASIDGRLKIYAKLDEQLANFFNSFTSFIKGASIYAGICPECSLNIPPSNKCTNCGEQYGSSDGLICDECGIEIQPQYDFCPSCEAELPDVKDVDEQATTARTDYADQQMREALDQITDQLDDLLLSISRVIQKARSEMNLFGWQFCPHCGGEYTVWEKYLDEDSPPRCILCDCTWEKAGLIWKKWKIRSPYEENHTKMSKKEWSKRGKELHNKNEFQKYYDYDKREELVSVIEYINKFVM